MDNPQIVKGPQIVDRNTVTYPSGAKRSGDVEGIRYDLMVHELLREYAMACGEGAVKYGDNNWKKGMPDEAIYSHAMEHLMKWNAGDRSENHLGKVVWGMGALLWNDIHRKETVHAEPQRVPEDVIADADGGRASGSKPTWPHEDGQRRPFNPYENIED
jgi:hypothetical protein